MDQQIQLVLDNIKRDNISPWAKRYWSKVAYILIRRNGFKL